MTTNKYTILLSFVPPVSYEWLTAVLVHIEKPIVIRLKESNCLFRISHEYKLQTGSPYNDKAKCRWSSVAFYDMLGDQFKNQ